MINPELIVLVGPPGSGKSTYCEGLKNYTRINQDEQGGMHKEIFQMSLRKFEHIVVDRMNFSQEQRMRYILPARTAGYKVKIVIFHVGEITCFERMEGRKGHPTILDADTASKALDVFFSFYERPTVGEADEIIDLGWDGLKTKALLCDLDGTLCNIDHRLGFMKEKKKDWKSFFGGIKDDKVDPAVLDIITTASFPTILMSGRPNSYRRQTTDWLNCHSIPRIGLYMRNAKDFRPDNIVKGMLYDFNVKPYYDIQYCLDDRPSVCRMWRSKGLKVLQLTDVEF